MRYINSNILLFDLLLLNLKSVLEFVLLLQLGIQS